MLLLESVNRKISETYAGNLRAEYIVEIFLESHVHKRCTIIKVGAHSSLPSQSMTQTPSELVVASIQHSTIHITFNRTFMNQGLFSSCSKLS